MSKVMGIYVKFWHFDDAHSPNMAMSRGQEANFEKNLFFLILHLILGKVTKHLVEKLSISEVISQKPHGGWKQPSPPPVLLGLTLILWLLYKQKLIPA